MSYEQLQLPLDIPTVQQSPRIVHDPYWDELDISEKEYQSLVQSGLIPHFWRCLLESQPPQKLCDNFDQCSLPEKANCPVGINCTFCNTSQSLTIAPEHSSCCVREQISLVPSPYKSVREQVKCNTAPAHQYFAPEQTDLEPPYKSVREQVKHDTAPEQPYFAPEQTHWVEKYWVKRGNKKYDYFRYCWMEGRKIRRIHIGSVNSTRASQKKEAVELAITEAESPDQIKQLIKCFETRQS